MGFAEQSNSSIRSNRALGNRMHKRVKRVLESSRKLSKRKSPPPSTSETKLTESQLNDLNVELKEQRFKSDMLKVFALLLSVLLLLAALWFIFFLLKN
jgi:hypothetical protein